MQPPRAHLIRPTVSPTVVAERLRDALTRVGDALVRVDVEGLLEAESELSLAVAAAASTGRPEDRLAARSAIRDARAALLRCRRLGNAFSSLARGLTRAGRPSEGYTRAGSYADGARARASLILARA